MKREKRKFYKGIFISILLITIIGTAYMAQLIEQQKKETQYYLYEISKKEAAIINKQITGDIEALRIMASTIKKKEEIEEETKDIINQNKLENNFEEIIIQINKNKMDKELLQNNNTIISKEKIMNGQSYYSYTLPITIGNEEIGKIIGIKKTNEIKTLIDTDIFYGEGYSQVINTSGEIIIRSNHHNSNKIVGNVFEVEFKKKEEKEYVKNNLIQGKNGTATIMYEQDKIEKAMTYVPIGTNDLFIATYVPSKNINIEFTRIILLSTTLIISVAIIISFFIYVMNKNKEINRKIILNLAYKDELTEGYNKNKFILEASQKIQEQEEYNIMVLNIKQFKNINQIFGREKGNELLKYIHRTIQKNLNKKEIIARTDDIFYFLILENNKEEKIQRIIKQIKLYTKENLLNYKLILKVGIYKIEKQERQQNIENLIDKAKYASELENEINYYDEKIKERIKNKNEIESNMEQALENNEFIIYIQPKYDTQTQTMVGGEVLVRWKRNNEIISPNMFIPIFEENNFIKKLDLYLFHKIGLKQKEWKEKNYEVVKLSINQSKKNIYDPYYIERLKDSINKNKIPTKLLEIELTESVFMNNQEILMKIEKQLHQLGMTIAMDDFGVGYSTYELLQKIKIDVLKLDQSFFKNIEDEKARIVIKGIINMTKELKIQTVAEGIEKKEEVEFLKEIGCEQIQGYYFSKPIPIEEFEKLICTTKKER